MTDLDEQMDKVTLSYSSILGIFEDTGMNVHEYNNLGTIFYVGEFSTSRMTKRPCITVVL